MSTQTEATPAIYAYLLMRTDLPSLGLGKSRAQAMHSGNHLTWELAVKPLKAGLPVPAQVEIWHDQGGGYGTAIALGGNEAVTLQTIQRVVSAAKALGLAAGEIVDETYPYVVDDEIFALLRDEIHTFPPARFPGGWRCCRRETTCAWLLGDKDALNVLLARFSLTPDALPGVR